MSLARGDGLVDDLQSEMSGQALATLNSVLDRVSADDFGNEPGSTADMAARAAITKKMDQDLKYCRTSTEVDPNQTWRK